MKSLGHTFRNHWFVGIFAILAAVWLVVEVAYLAGSDGVSFRNRYTGQRASIDFGRKHDRPFVALSDDVGMELNSAGPHLHGAVNTLKSGLPVVCWLCGDLRQDEGIGIVAYRQGDWFYRAPDDNSRNSEALHGRPQSRAYILTIAYNRATHERVQVPAAATLAAQTQVLAARGLVVDESARLSQSNLADLAPVSMQREGCVVVQLAFLSAALLWLVLGSGAALIIRGTRRRR